MAKVIPFTFKVYRGDALQREEQLSVGVPGVVKIGRLETSHLRLDDESVSKMHAVIEVTSQAEIQLMDLGSAKGTLLKGVRVTKANVSDGDELTLGDMRIVVGLREAVEQPGATPAPQPAVSPVGTTQPLSAPMMGAVGSGGGPAPMAVPTTPMGAALRSSAPIAQAPPVGSAEIERQDGSRAIEVTTMFHDAVLAVRHLDNPAGGTVSSLTWGLLGAGGLVAFAGLIMGLLAVVGVAGVGEQYGFIGLLLVLGCGVGVYAYERRLEELRSPDFTLGGSTEADVPLAHAAVPDALFPLVKADGQQYALVFTDGMVGDVTLGAQRTDLRQLVDAGQAHRHPGYAQAYEYPIPVNARIKLDIGENTFLVNSVTPARRVIGPLFANMDWATKVGLSFAAHLLLLFLVFAVPPDAKALSLDLFDADNKLVKYLTKPPEQKDEELPSWLKKRGPDKAGGKGQRHKGEEGKMGKKDSKKKRGLYGLKGPKDNPDPHLAKQLAETQAEQAGVLGLLGSPSGSHLASIFGRDTALGTDAEDALGGLIGDTIGEAYGVGGLGLVGSGRGGGGTGEGTIGLGSLGTIGKGGGGGDGAGYGRGAGRLGGRRATVPRVVAGRAEVRGSLDKEIIRRIIRRHINEVKYCYSKELQTDEDLGGRVVVQFTIAATGQVVTAKVQNSTLGSAKVEQCIAQAVRRWLFPKPKGGGIVIVSYPFVLRAAGS